MHRQKDKDTGNINERHEKTYRQISGISRQMANRETSSTSRTIFESSTGFPISYKIIHSHTKCQIPYILTYSHTKGQVFVNFEYYLILSGSVTLFGPSE